MKIIAGLERQIEVPFMGNQKIIVFSKSFNKFLGACFVQAIYNISNIDSLFQESPVSMPNFGAKRWVLYYSICLFIKLSNILAQENSLSLQRKLTFHSFSILFT